MTVLDDSGSAHSIGTTANEHSDTTGEIGTFDLEANTYYQVSIENLDGIPGNYTCIIASP
ncbi:MAG: hypothetical protein JEY91_14060 [Spirochaetaceae bacterium]|nr:hypothetical protein [Spirochaetaceae bacterium]